ncbi:NfeD family protein [Kocuria palustris]|uniref:NfeD family protein n=1 Tax=Kocuria palustris TaxID=71999 RepID=UPI0016425677|nr:NfeD family protein [Kocuria palustris]
MTADGWILWLIVAAVLIVIEVLTLDLTFLMLSIGAVAAAAFSGLDGGSWALQIVVFIGVSLLLLFVVRPPLIARMQRGPGREGLSNADRLPGSSCTVLEPVSSATGLVRLHGDVWSARTSGPEIPVGETVYVQRVDGAAVVVDRSAPALGDPDLDRA